jgi:16S rRNA (cytidine1402-2'-O)-methyltransferase
LDILKDVDCIACEDTRHSAPLLQHYGIKKPLISYHDHNAASKRPVLLEKLQQGARVALISDAGTPLIADPGYKLVAACAPLGIPVFTIPGCSAVIAALSIAGLPTDKFCFLGFLPPKAAGRRTALETVKHYPMTLAYYETPQRIVETLEDIAAVLGNRQVAVAKELTKLYEQVIRGTVAEVLAILSSQAVLKGEMVLLIGGAEEEAYSEAVLLGMLRQARQTYSVKEAVATVAGGTGLPRKDIYQLALREGV